MTVTVSGGFHDPTYPGVYSDEMKQHAIEAFDTFVEDLREAGFVVNLTLQGAVSHDAHRVETPVSEPLADGELAPKDDSEE